jgi:hypothetical protein
MTSDKLLSLENIRQQYRQDLLVSYKNCMFRADPQTLFLIKSYNISLDKDGFPSPFAPSDHEILITHLEDALFKARKNYYDRMFALGIDKLTAVKSESDEAVE